MLVLSRKKNQTIVVDHEVEIEVLQIKGSTVRLGIKAPQQVKILRGELQPVPVGEITLPIKQASETDESSSQDSQPANSRSQNNRISQKLPSGSSTTTPTSSSQQASSQQASPQPTVPGNGLLGRSNRWASA